MANWHFWGEKKVSSVYENIYIRTVVEDWFRIVFSLVDEIGKVNKMLDVGCGEGHTTKQILDRLEGNPSCDILEPNKKALKIAKKFLSYENKIDNSYRATLAKFETKNKYDLVFTSHTNYYWAKKEKDYQDQLMKLTTLIEDKGKLLILTLPEDSDHYNVALKQVYPKFNYSGYVTEFYRRKGFKVKVKRFKMRMYVGDILSTRGTFDLKVFYKFIHNLGSPPSSAKSIDFLKKIKQFQKGDYLDFRDELLIITK